MYFLGRYISQVSGRGIQLSIDSINDGGIHMLRATITFVLLIYCTSMTSADQTAPLAPGYSSLGYPVPPPGSYSLPAFAAADDGLVIDSDGNHSNLHDLFGSRYVLLNFMYSSCNDINGCPLSSFVYYQLRTEMEKNPQLAKNLRLISLSFDPERDSPEVMKLYANNFINNRKNSHQWQFATTKDEETLLPILESYSQDVQRTMSTESTSAGDISHVLRVFLIDPQKKIRNIYSVSFLHKDLILADLNTLLMEENILAAGTNTLPEKNLRMFGPGDKKEGYDTAEYTTQSRSLTSRTGTKADLFAATSTPQLGLPKLDIPEDIRITPESIDLGRKLFFDRRLSLNDTFSCAMCHIPEQGFASNELAKAVGIEGRSVRRNTPGLYNVGFAKLLFHDGREDSLPQQVWGPLLAKNEMGNPSIGYLINKIKRLPDYQDLFENTFNGKKPTMETVGQALSAYQISLVSGNSPFDRWYYGKNESAVSQSVKNGFNLFTGKARCSSCHLVGETEAIFSDHSLHNTGLGYISSRVDPEKTKRVQLAPGVFVDVKKELIDRVGLPTKADLGLYEITENPDDRWKFKTPILRNVELTAPYMHNGSLSTLRDVVEFYNQGGIENPLLDPLMQPLKLSELEIDEIVEFMRALTGSNVESIVADAYAAPVGDIHSDDPHWAHEFNEATK